MKITIDETQFPWINDIEKSKREEVILKYIEIGRYVATTSDLSIDPFKNLLEPVKNELSELAGKNNELLKIIEQNIQVNMQDVKKSIDKLVSGSKNSVLKGGIGENLIEQIIKEQFPDDVLENTSKQAEESDYHLTTNDGDKILIEVKTYSKPVNKGQIDKFIRDMDKTGIKVGIFISTTSGIIGKKRLSIEKSIKDQYAIFIPNSGLDGLALVWGILLAKQLCKIDKNKGIKIDVERIYELFGDFESTYNELCKIRYEILKSKNSVNEIMENLYKQALDIEMKVKYMLQNSREKIMNELVIVGDKYKKDELLKFIDDLKEKKDKRVNGYEIMYNICDRNEIQILSAKDDKERWLFYNINEELLGEIKPYKGKLELIYKKKPIVLVVCQELEAMIEEILCS
jgi:hypothetical protein